MRQFVGQGQILQMLTRCQNIVVSIGKLNRNVTHILAHTHAHVHQNAHNERERKKTFDIFSYTIANI